MIMGPKTLTGKVISALTAVDLVFIPLVTYWYFDLLGIIATRNALLTMLVLFLLKLGACAAYVRSHLEPYDILAHTRTSERTAAMVLRADEKMQTVVTRVGFFFAHAWAVTFALVSIVLHSRIGEEQVLNSGFWEVTAIAFPGIWCGAFCAGAPVISLITDSAAGECSTIARGLGLTLPRSPESLQARIGFIAFVLAVGPTMCFMAVGYTKQIQSLEQQNQAQAQQYANRLADRYSPQIPLT
jgi:hypothetical protein